MKKNDVSIAVLIQELDDCISKFVRLRVADKYGYINCISCGARVGWRNAHCAHFKDRTNMATRFYLPNLAPACQHCNLFNEDEHLQKWKSKMTDEQLQDLETRAKSLMKWTRAELLFEIDFYKTELNKLQQTNHFIL